jgi:sulfate adenylyltransferase subunit 2
VASLGVETLQSAATPRLSHLQMLEAESIHIFREVAAEFEKPVMLYSIGKDSSVMLRLAQKAFYPGPIPFPLLHIDTSYKFKEMIAFRDEYTRKLGVQLLVWRNEAALADGANPITLGTRRCCGLLKTTAPMGSTPPSGEPVAMRKNPAPRSASSLFAITPANGIRKTSAPSSGTSITRG